MSQQIAITKTENIRPVFAHGVSENIKRFHQLKKLFIQSKAYQILAEPAPAGGDKVSWSTEFDGRITDLVNLNESEKHEALGRLKNQVNEMYRAALINIPEPKKQNSKELFDVIDSCIEIPDESFIKIVQNQNGKTNFVIFQWGFTYDDFNASTGLIANLVPIKIADYTLLVVDDLDKPLTDKRITLEYQNKVKNFVTDNQGKIYLENIELFTEVKAYTRASEGKKDHLHEFHCYDEPLWIMKIGAKRNAYTFCLVDEDGNLIPNEKISFEIEGEIQHFKTNEQGQVEIQKIVENSTIGYFQQGKPVRNVNCSSPDEPIRITGFAPVVEETKKIVPPVVSPPPVKTPSPASTNNQNTYMHVKIVDAKQNPIEGVRVDIKGLSSSLTQITPTSGMVDISAFIDEHFDINLEYKGKRYEHQVICKEKDQTTILQIGKKKTMWLWWLILLLLLLIAYFVYQNFFTAPKIPIVPPTDTITDVVDEQTKMSLHVLDKETKEPIVFAEISLVINSTESLNQITDSIGLAAFLFDSIPTDLSAVITATDYPPYNTTLEYKKEKTVYLSKEKSTEVFEKPLPCGTEALSGGFGTTVKVFDMTKSKGVFDLYFAPYELPDKIAIYRGRPDQMSEETLIWATGPKGVSGKKTFQIEFESSNNLITVETEGLVGKTKWKYKVNCPK